MLLSLGQGVTMTFIGVEVVTIHASLGTAFRPLAQCSGCALVFQGCLLHRLVDIPYADTSVKLAALPRPDRGPQGVSLASATGAERLTVSTTARPRPLWVTQYVRLSNFSAAVPAESAPGAAFGGYTMQAYDTLYLADYTLAAGCLAARPADECMSQLLADVAAGREARIFTSSLALAPFDDTLSGTRLVTSSREFRDALNDTSITQILLNSTITVTSDWNDTVYVTRNVTVRATRALMVRQKYATIDFGEQNMIFGMPKGVLMTFVGIDAFTKHLALGASFRPLRMCDMCAMLYVSSLIHRMVGLPYPAGLVNQINAPRYPPGGTQQLSLNYEPISIATTAVPSLLLTKYIVMDDWSGAVPQDTSLASQQLYFGGYVVSAVGCVYLNDYIVSPQCLASQPGNVCLTVTSQEIQSGALARPLAGTLALAPFDDTPLPGMRLVTTSAEFRAALENANVTEVLINGTITPNTSEWLATVEVTRNVTVRATKSLLSQLKYATINWDTSNMLIGLARGIDITFIGIDMHMTYPTVGIQLRFMRQCDRCSITVISSFIHRLVGIPYPLGIAAQLQAPRPFDDKPQLLEYYNTSILVSTTSATARWREYAMMFDFRVPTPPDISLASQGLLFGGNYAWTLDCVYATDYVVPASCLQSRSGADCVTLTLQAIINGTGPAAQFTTVTTDDTAAPPSPQPSGGGGGDSNSAAVIVPAVVVPTVCLLAGIAGLVVWHHRRRSAADEEQGRPGAGKRASGSGGAEGAGLGPTRPPTYMGIMGGVQGSDGGVFMGVEEGKELPEWQAEAHDETDDMGDPDQVPGLPTLPEGPDGGRDEITFSSGTGTAPASSRAPDPTAGATCGAGEDGNGNGDGAGPRTPGKAAGGVPSGPNKARPEAAIDSGGNAITSGNNAITSGQNAAPSRKMPALAQVTLQRQATDHAAAMGAAAGVGPAAAAGVGAGAPAGGGAGAGGGGGGGGDDASGRGRSGPVDGMRAGNNNGRRPLPTPAEVMEELGRLGQEFRNNVKDVTIVLEGILGHGSFGTVYKGTWQGLPVAIKTVVFSANAENRKRALQEAALCQSISHPNIIATYASELQPIGGPLADSAAEAAAGSGKGLMANPSMFMDWRLYIIQEFADGGPLTGLYGNRSMWLAPGVVNLGAVVPLGLGIARALVHLHSKRIIHGDLNPNNVLLKQNPEEPSGFTVKVADFGLSLMLPEHQTHMSNLRMGTMFYICPAVVMKGHVGQAADIFSLGVILWELYHGRRAGIYTKEGPRYCTNFPVFPPACPEHFRAITLRCLQRQPINRPSAAQVVEALERLLASSEAVAGVGAEAGAGAYPPAPGVGLHFGPEAPATLE
ncbi:hypothetical protein HYH03_005904 [Edaphochlamys debaryana]|uniref:Protein kinase domain-containing protein n=1 Tax=Edaphochlamys debaryana TaxID=47281 RepID=A0A835Y4J6_9CHLO|nr:hypothetical protein HYH03_005904 [Edaphochlamys debaryana]|eukprot:KAG2495975.1 hypothetical protein HYH03_005904 [Edaphochlamys debaryana]